LFSVATNNPGTDRKVGDHDEDQGTPRVTVSIPDNHKDQPAIRYELTFWGPDATFAHPQFHNGTVLTARGSVTAKNDRQRLNVPDLTPLHNGSKPKGDQP